MVLSAFISNINNLNGKERNINDKEFIIEPSIRIFGKIWLFLTINSILRRLYLPWGNDCVLQKRMDRDLFHFGKIPILSMQNEQYDELLTTQSIQYSRDHYMKNGGEIQFIDGKFSENKMLKAIPPGFSQDRSFNIDKSSPFFSINSVSYVETNEGFISVGKYCSSIEMVSISNNPGYVQSRYMQITAYYTDNTNSTTGYVDNYFGYTTVTLNCDQNKVLKNFSVKHKIRGTGSYSIMLGWGLRDYIQYNWYGLIYTRPLQTVIPTFRETFKETVSRTLDMTLTPVRTYDENLIICTCISNDYIRIVKVFGFMFALLLMAS